jgi:hypothetical protein
MMAAMEGQRRLAARWALMALAAHLVLSGVLLAANDGNPEWFIHFGDRSPGLPLGEQVLGDDVLVPHEDGQDGVYFWVLARDPLLGDADQAVRFLDRPAYRSQRLAYPLLAAPWRAGGEQALVWGLLATNLLAVAVGAYGATRLALQLGAPARAGLLFALNPATVAAVVMDAADAVALAALLWALLLVARGRLWPAVAAGTVAVLTKEPMLLALGGVALLAPRLTLRTRLSLVGVPTLAALAWGLYARWRLGWPASDIEELTVPFSGYLDAYRRGWRPVGNWGDAALALALLPLAAATCVLWWRRRSLLLAAAVPFALLIPFFTAQVLNLPGNSIRAVGPVVTLLGLSLYVPRPSPAPPGGTAPADAAAAAS